MKHKIFISTLFLLLFIKINSPIPNWDLNSISKDLLYSSSSINVTLYDKIEYGIRVSLIK